MIDIDIGTILYKYVPNNRNNTYDTIEKVEVVKITPTGKYRLDNDKLVGNDDLFFYETKIPKEWTEQIAKQKENRENLRQKQISGNKLIKQADRLKFYYSRHFEVKDTQKALELVNELLELGFKDD